MSIRESDPDLASDLRPLVDGTLIDELLALTPEERLRQNDRMIRTVKELQDGFARKRADDASSRPGRRSG